MNDKPNTPPGWNLLGPGNNGTPTDKAAEQPAPMSAEERAKAMFMEIDALPILTAPGAGRQKVMTIFTRYFTAHAAEQAAEIARLKERVEERHLKACDNENQLQNELVSHASTKQERNKLRSDLADAQATIAERDAEIARLRTALLLVQHATAPGFPGSDGAYHENAYHISTEALA